MVHKKKTRKNTNAIGSFAIFNIGLGALAPKEILLRCVEKHFMFQLMHRTKAQDPVRHANGVERSDWPR